MSSLDRLRECRACVHRAGDRCAETGRLLSIMTAQEPWACPHGAAVLPQAPPQRLAVVASLFNPAGYEALPDNWRHWRAGLQPLLDAGRLSHCLTAEALYPGQRPTVDVDRGDLVIEAGPDQVLWQKERLLNLAIDALPDDVTHVAWIDPDVHFLNPHWPEDTVAELQRVPVVQLFERVVTETALHGPLKIWPATMAIAPRSECFRTGNKPGFAWAARRSTLAASGGLFDAGLSGSGDLYMVYAWTGTGEQRLQLPALYEGEPMLRCWRAWAERSAAAVRQRVGCVRGTIVHRWHGTRKDRKYVERHEVARRHQFDPARDLELAPNGLWRWTDPGSALARETAEYFRARNDDHGRRAA